MANLEMGRVPTMTNAGTVEVWRETEEAGESTAHPTFTPGQGAATTPASKTRSRPSNPSTRNLPRPSRGKGWSGAGRNQMEEGRVIGTTQSTEVNS